MSVYAPWHHGHLSKALQSLHLSSNSMEWVSKEIFFHTLQQCVENRDCVAAKETHSLLVLSGFDSDAFIVCHLIRAYALLDDLHESQKVFLRAFKPTTFSWSAIISAHANLEQAHQALELYKQMQKLEVKLDGHVFVAVLKACIALEDFKEGKTVHAHIVAYGLHADAFMGSFLVDMYVKCASLEEATIAFQGLPRRNVISWNALIAGYVNNGHEQIALHLFHELQQRDAALQGVHDDIDVEDVVSPDFITYLHVLKACSSLVLLEQGQSVHADIIAKGIGLDLSVGNTLIDMYGKCGSIRDACIVFDALPIRNVVSWSVLISRHTQQGFGSEALKLFKQMQGEGIQPDNFTFVCALKACSMQGGLNEGKEIHKHVMVRGLESDDFIVSILVDMYSKCESCSDARNIFDRLPNPGLVTWNAMISGYVQYGEVQEALKLFHQMRQFGMGADQATYVSVLKACSSLGAFHQGLELHAEVVGNGFELDLFVSTTLIDLYSQSGNVEDSYRIFNRIVMPDVVSWNALIAACAQHNEYQLAVGCFQHMQNAGASPNHATLVCILSVCSHAGLVNEGCAHFKSMRDVNGIVPTVELYDSMVDLLGHSGRLEEAEDLLETHPFAPNFTEWTSLLSSCRRHGDLGIARRCFDIFVTMDHANAAGYALMSNIYAHVGMHADAEEIELLRKYANAWKKPAKAYIELDTHVHEFSVGGEAHPQSKDIYAKLDELSIQMHEDGYKARVDLVLNADQDREKSLCGHCEKLAIAFGLICTPSGTTLRVTKNLRVCVDCHNATKIISKIEMREIIITDAYRCHRFKDGDCSCKDHY
eukprot:c19016_g1_i1 orf=418-2880(+)